MKLFHEPVGQRFRPVEGEDQIQWSTSKILFEHARTRDELMEAPTAVRGLGALGM